MYRHLTAPSTAPAADPSPGRAGVAASPEAPARAASGFWPKLLLLVAAGVVSAFQVGKVPVAMTALQQSLAIDVATASWLLSAFALVGGVLGIWIGLSIDNWGARRMALAGLVIQGACSALGAAGDSVAVLLALRVLEGVGFLAVIVAVPALIAVVTPESVHGRAFAAWGTFMPLGMAMMMLTAPWIERLGWRGLWAGNALLLFLCAAVLAAGTRQVEDSRQARWSRATGKRPPLGAVISAPGPWLVAALFALFTAMFFSIFGFLPLILSHRMGIDGAAIGILSAAAVVTSAIGNLACGWLLARGIDSMRLLALGLAAMGIASVGVVAPIAPGAVAYLMCLVMSLASGLVPVVLFAAAPRQAPSPDQLGATLGMAMQGNNLGLLIGPAAAGAIAGAWGWSSVACWTGLLALVALMLVRAVRRLDS